MGLPPGQHTIDEFPRFGLPAFATRFPEVSANFALRITGDVESPIDVAPDRLRELPRSNLVSDLHCVTTWSRLGLRWAGYRFRDVYEQLIRPDGGRHPQASFILFKGLDGYRASLLLDDALGADVLIADQLDDLPLSFEHGAPLRLVAPDRYGYKSVKHLSEIRFLSQRPDGSAGWREHLRARVALEERSGVALLPGRVCRLLYRPMVPFTIWYFKRAARQRQSP